MYIYWTWGEQLSLWEPDFNYVGYMLRGRITRSYDNIIFTLLRSLRTVFHRDCTISHSHWPLTHWQVFCKMSLSLALSDMFLWLDWCYRFFHNNIPHSIKGCRLFICLITGPVSLDHLCQAVSASFSNIQFALYFLCHILSAFVLNCCVSYLRSFYLSQVNAF